MNRQNTPTAVSSCGSPMIETERRLNQSLAVAPTACAELSQLLLIKSAGRLLFLKVSDLKWAEAERDYLRLHLEREGHFIRDTMNNFQQRLDSNLFIRIHRSTIVDVNEISEILPLLGATTVSSCATKPC
jgi:DNA-binding LytR/AlgR family response regulator